MTDSSAPPRNNGERPLHEDDPLMELSRILDFGATAENNSAQNTQHSEPEFGVTEDDFTLDSALDLERELMGDFGDLSAPELYTEQGSSVPDTSGPDTSGFDVYSEPVSASIDDFQPDDFQLDIEDVSFAENDLAAALEHELDVHMSEHELQNALHDLEFVEPVAAEPVPQFDYNDYSAARDTTDAEVSVDGFTSAAADVQSSEFYQDESDFEPTFDEQAFAVHQSDVESTPQSQHGDHYASQFSPENEWDNAPTQDQSTFVEPDLTPSHVPVEPVTVEAVRPVLSLEDELQNLLFGDDQPVQNEAPSYTQEPENPSFDSSDDSSDWVALQDEQTEVEQDYPFEPFVPAPFNDEAMEPFETSISEQEFVAAPHAKAEAAHYPHYPRGNFSPDAPVTSVLSAEPHHDELIDDRLEMAGNDLPADDFSFGDDFALHLDQALESGAVDEPTGDEFTGLDNISFEASDFSFEESGDGNDTDNVETESVFDEENFFSIEDLDLASEDFAVEQPENSSFAHATYADEADDFSAIAFAPKFDPSVPEVETISVGESKVEQTHALDLPEVPYEDEDANSGLSDLESEFAEVFNTIEIDDASSRSESQSEADRAFEDIFRENASSYLAAGAVAGAALGATAASGKPSPSAATQNQSQTFDAGGNATNDDFYNHWAASGAQSSDGNQFGSHSNLSDDMAEEDLGSAAEAYRNRPIRGRRGLIVASIAGIAVLVGGVGYHFLAGGGSGEPVVIRASDDPVKVQPENPGGVVVPNQDKAVYDRVAGTLPGSPEQKSLIASGEEPVDLAAAQDFSPAEEETVEPFSQSGDTQNAPLIKPREVETMIVRSDGSIIAPQMNTQPATEPAPVQARPEDGDLIAPPAENDEIAALAAGGQIPAANELTTTEPAVSGATATDTPVQLPVRAPLVPSRPAQQPVNVVGNVPQRTQAPAAAQGQTQVASAAAAGGYFIQIASQPTPELAQQSYANMAQRYGSVIGGRAVDIKRADIPNKGTYYRVRVQAGTKDAANALCTSLKSAGGSCFVTQ